MRLLVIVFLILNASNALSHASSAGSGTEDRFNFGSLVGRGGPSLVTSPSDLPDDITPVDVKDEGNASDPDTGLGMVLQEYSIGQTEVTAKQYCNYLNVVATGDNYVLFYNEKMGSDPNVASIKRSVVNGKNKYSVIVDQQGDRGNFPIAYVNLYQAARFCNWLQNQSTPGLTGDKLTERGAYTLNGKSSGPIARNPGAVWFIPTESEWYKPAYYKGGGLKEGYWHFANRSDWAPSSSLVESGVNNANYNDAKKSPPYLTTVDNFKKSVGAYNTHDMSGNVAEWVATEEKQGAAPLKYVARGGSWKSLYYGTMLGSKFDVAGWGMELSKWSRPAYDPAQGYDNIGFRVATSLVVNSVPPNKAAPGATELSPTETIEAPLLILLGGATLFSGKKIYDYRPDSEAKRVAEAAQRERERESTAGDPTSGSQAEEERDPSAVARIGERVDPLTPKKGSADFSEKLSITQAGKEEIEASIEAIDPPFRTAVEQYQGYKLFLQKHRALSADGLQKLQEMCVAYDAYATAVAKTADNIKEKFPEEQELWIPWHTVAMNVAIEAMMLRHAAIKPYYRVNIFISQDQATPKQKVMILRNDSNQKTLQHIATIRNYHKALQAAISEQENVSEESVAETTLQKVEAEMTSLAVIESTINEHESNIQSNVAEQATAVNGAYSAYEEQKEKENDNLFALFFLNTDGQPRNINNLVSSAQLKERFQQFLSQVQEEFRSSDGMMQVTPGSGGNIASYGTTERDSIGGMVNPQSAAGAAQAGAISRQQSDSTKGQIVPFAFDHFRNPDLLSSVTAGPNNPEESKELSENKDSWLGGSYYVVDKPKK